MGIATTATIRPRAGINYALLECVLLVLVGQKKALAMAVKNHLGRWRCTKLAEWLSGS